MQHWLGQDESHLVEVEGKHRLQAEVRDNFLRMRQAAQAAGIDLQMVSSFRSFAQQCAIWRRKWQGELPLYALDNTLIDSATLNDTQRLHAMLLWSALPGGSRHHWGTDIDVYDKARVEASGIEFQLISSEYEPPGPCSELSHWLAENAANFGFVRPYAKYVGGIGAEPWHLSYAPIATQIEQQFDPNALKRTILDANLPASSLIAEHFDELYRRYVRNQGATDA
ncbi:M15 family metallopeptidase [Alteromonas sp. ASW11-36]|uniref:M15 family metallopeptidase n=1 Tax=Alteromonas arenosi TaxID=3055817 RepID=A0ABT7T025_9ALTE|nr:M15 family metallopeptidase [Alteromonas sp. ASW11-36]MDM7861167.1 M15 family metallopeptidase [Alteromonas sp. ASW11-36]